jgi:hypothetical protein
LQTIKSGKKSTKVNTTRNFPLRDTFDFIDKITFPYLKSRYEAAILSKQSVLFVTSTDTNYENWKWNVYRVIDDKLELLRQDVYQ